MSSRLEDHFFRREYGRLVAMLVRRVGARHLGAVEDAVQAALLAAVESWSRSAVPENPSAWLYRVAHNHFVDERRRLVRHGALAARYADATPESVHAEPDVPSSDSRDDLLRLLFVCCDETIPIDSQLVLALRTVCGFDVRENRGAALHERSQRLQTPGPRPHPPAYLTARVARAHGRAARVATGGRPNHPVHVVHGGSPGLAGGGRDPPRAVRRGAEVELVARRAPAGRDAADVRAGRTDAPASSAQAGAAGRKRGLVLLEEQDRSLWDQDAIRLGLSWLARAAQGDVFSRYHAEAGVAAEHCLAPSFSETRWDRIVECYTLLERLAPSVLHTLNRALAVAEWRGPAHGLAVLEGLEPPSWLVGSYSWSAVLADLHRRAGDAELAARYRETALRSAPSEAVRTALERRLR